MDKSSTKMWTTFVIFKKLPKVNNQPMGGNFPNLVTPLLLFNHYFEKHN
jgi:hypothetical protein